MKKVFVDTNILARFLVGDAPDLVKKATKIFEDGSMGKNDIYLDEVVLSEAVWLFDKFYKLHRTEIAKSLEDLLSQDFVKNPRKGLMLKALGMYKRSKFSYVDCWVKVTSGEMGATLVTFDKDLEKYI
jgi:predicted nucleic-acid-binding protein